MSWTPLILFTVIVGDEEGCHYIIETKKDTISNSARVLSIHKVGSRDLIEVKSDPVVGEFCHFLEVGQYEIAVKVSEKEKNMGLQPKQRRFNFRWLNNIFTTIIFTRGSLTFRFESSPFNRQVLLSSTDEDGEIEPLLLNPDLTVKCCTLGPEQPGGGWSEPQQKPGQVQTRDRRLAKAKTNRLVTGLGHLAASMKGGGVSPNTASSEPQTLAQLNVDFVMECISGLLFHPLVKNITVVDGPVLSGIEFIQLKVQVFGKITNIPESGNVFPNIPVSLKMIQYDQTEEIVTLLKTHAKDGAYSFDNILPGKYEVTVEKNEWCWESTSYIIDVNSLESTVPIFVQTGFTVTFVSSHDTEVLYNLKTSHDIDQSSHKIFVKSGITKVCVSKAGVYEFKPLGCHGYTQPVFHWNSAAMPVSPVKLTAISHTVGGHVISSENVSDIYINVVFGENKKIKTSILRGPRIGITALLKHFGMFNYYTTFRGHRPNLAWLGQFIKRRGLFGCVVVLADSLSLDARTVKWGARKRYHEHLEMKKQDRIEEDKKKAENRKLDIQVKDLEGKRKKLMMATEEKREAIEVELQELKKK
uniref:Nodal modulator 1 n=1 Tax=Timema douglasi TaxID=61478 RepID=A0A7R8VGH2_TIMDO|nr:unnamed protein product [Timema douglasi]